MEQTVNERIRQIMKTNDCTANSLAKGNNTLQRKLQRQINEDSTVTSDVLSLIVKTFPSINSDWLLTGDGQEQRDNVVEITPDELNAPVGVPVYDIDATCGKEMRSFEDGTIVGHIDLPEIRRDSVIIKATGDSMKPVILSGDRIAVREIKSWDYIAFGQIYLIETAEYRLLKYIRKSDNPDIIILRSENTDYDDIEMPKADIVRLFIVENILTIKNCI